jgi:hypothetical protein
MFFSYTTALYLKSSASLMPIRYILCMCLLLLRAVLNELTRPRGEAAMERRTVEVDLKKRPNVNITENKLNAALGGATEPADGASDDEAAVQGTKAPTTFLSYKDEAENYALQHQVNKLKQHHRRAFELISRALQIDEETGSKDVRQGFVTVV